MLTGYTSLFSVLHAAGSFQCCLLARSCRLPTCSYRFTTPSCRLSTRSCSLSTCSCRFTTPSCRLSTRSCRLSTCSCALHSHCTNSRSPKMSCILLVIIQPLTHEALDHLHSLCSEVDDDTSYIHHLLLLQLVQNTVNGYQSTSPTNTSTVWT